MALKLSGKDERLTPRDFLTLARTIELPEARGRRDGDRSGGNAQGRGYLIAAQNFA
jgi:hypothetical protein